MAFGADVLPLDFMMVQETMPHVSSVTLESTYEQWSALTVMLPIALASWLRLTLSYLWKLLQRIPSYWSESSMLSDFNPLKVGTGFQEGLWFLE
jgi:hypothetical protein